MALDGRAAAATAARRHRAAWRSIFAWLPQRPHLFNATMADNLRLGRTDAADGSDLQRVLDAVGLAELLATLPAGLRTVLGHDGLTLSAGERQRRGAGPRPPQSGAGAAARRADRRARPPDGGAARRRPSSHGSRAGRWWWPRTSPSCSPASTSSMPLASAAPDTPGGLAVSRRRVVLRRVLADPGTPSGRLALAGLLGLASAAATIGLLAGSGYVVGRAALRPGLGAIVGILAAVEVLAFLRGPLRYAERLVGHDAALRALTRWRVWLYDCLTPRVPAALAGWRSGDLLSRAIDDVDALQDLYLRTVLPVAVAVGAGALGRGARRRHPALGGRGSRGSPRRRAHRAGRAHLAAERRRRDGRPDRCPLRAGGRRAQRGPRAAGLRRGRGRPRVRGGAGGDARKPWNIVTPAWPRRRRCSCRRAVAVALTVTLALGVAAVHQHRSEW